MKILHVIATPRGDHSQTLPFSRAFLGHLAKVRPDLTVQELDLSTTTLPTIDDTIASTKYRLMQGLPVDLDAAKTWPRVEALIDDFVSADLCLITTPMWNF
ncbi:MAG TPA: NAD(P)H-dependent oxidoreductase, partial [Ornithinibacter sp.]|nr:NAD(P)H-dependent oxidoreductase [Ornithinibacter sp.]